MWPSEAKRLGTTGLQGGPWDRPRQNPSALPGGAFPLLKPLLGPSICGPEGGVRVPHGRSDPRSRRAARTSHVCYGSTDKSDTCRQATGAGAGAGLGDTP